MLRQHPPRNRRDGRGIPNGRQGREVEVRQEGAGGGRTRRRWPGGGQHGAPAPQF